MDIEKRFVVVWFGDLTEGQAEEYGIDTQDWGNALVDTRTGKVVACDGGEPEDQTLVRNWAWVPRLLNAVAAGG